VLIDHRMRFQVLPPMLLQRETHFHTTGSQLRKRDFDNETGLAAVACTSPKAQLTKAAVGGGAFWWSCGPVL
jgi:hypothetical protein